MLCFYTNILKGCHTGCEEFISSRIILLTKAQLSQLRWVHIEEYDHPNTNEITLKKIGKNDGCLTKKLFNKSGKANIYIYMNI